MATINRLVKKDTRIFAPAKCARLIARPFKEVRPNDEFRIDELIIKTVYAYNTPSGSSTRKVHHKCECDGYLLSIYRITIYHAGDTDVVPEMKELGKVDIAFILIGGTFTMNLKEAIEAVSIINPREVVPMHYLKTDPKIFKKKAEILDDTKVEVLETGGVVNL